MPEPGLARKVVRIDRALTRAKVSHAFGGALALAYYAVPRATVDIDINVFTPPEGYPEVSRILKRVGVNTFPPDQEVLERGQCRTWWGRTPVDLFFSYDEIHEAMAQHFRMVPFGSTKIPVLAPEHLLVAKFAFDRPKDWIDIEQMLIATDDLDIGEINRWVDHLLDLHDARAARLASLIDRTRGKS
jgi:hypothetical protein